MRIVSRTLLAIVLLGTAVLVFAGAIDHDFTNWDDGEYVVGNRAIERLDAAGVREMFRPSSVVVGNWAPLTILSYAVDYSLWGRRPFGYHLTNVLLHALAVVLLFLLLDRILSRGDPDASLAPAAIAAALFAIHPVQVESVAWIAERKNVLGMVFLLAAFLAWLRATTPRLRPGAYLVFLFLFAAALLAKAQGVFLPPLLVLYEWLERPATAVPARVRAALLVPAFALAIGVGLVTIEAQQSGAQLSPVPGFTGAVATAPILVLGYVKDILLPMNRSAILPRPVYGSPWAPAPLAAWVVLLAWVALALHGRRARPHAAFFSLWFLGVLAPVLNFVPLSVLAADRYQYWAAPGLFALAGMGAWRAWRGLGASRRVLLAALVAATLGSFAGLTLARVSVWKDSVSLWSDAVRKTPAEIVARTNLASALIVAGRSEDAIVHLRHVLRLQPWNFRLRINLAVALLNLGRVEEAIGEGRAATTLNPRLPEAWLLYGTALEAGGRREEAIAAVRRVIALRPGDPAAMIHLRSLEGGQGRP